MITPETELQSIAVSLLRELHRIDGQVSDLRDGMEMRAREAVRAADEAVVKAWKDCLPPPIPTRPRARRRS